MRRRKPSNSGLTLAMAQAGRRVGKEFSMMDLIGKPVEEPVQKEYGHRYVPQDEVTSKTVRVTAYDILESAGHGAEAWGCPIARALARTFRSDDVSVSTQIAHVNYRSYFLPKEAREFVRAFDSGREVLPFSFRLEGRPW